MLGVSVDDESTAPDLPAFVAQQQMRYIVASSPESLYSLRMAYNAKAIPSIYLIDKHGRIRWSAGGYSPSEEAELNILIQKLMAEK